MSVYFLNSFCVSSCVCFQAFILTWSTRIRLYTVILLQDGLAISVHCADYIK